MSKAKEWLNAVDPDGSLKPGVRGLLILAYGAGLDAGLAEAQEIIEELKTKLARGEIPPELAGVIRKVGEQSQ